MSISKVFPKKVKKNWGYELWMHNDSEYCGKILRFDKGAMFSMHYHLLKKETWYVSSGKFLLHTIDTSDASTGSIELNVGDIVTVDRGQPHQLEAVEEGDIFEVSTEHFDSDSYRIIKGNR